MFVIFDFYSRLKSFLKSQLARVLLINLRIIESKRNLSRHKINQPLRRYLTNAIYGRTFIASHRNDDLLVYGKSNGVLKKCLDMVFERLLKMLEKSMLASFYLHKIIPTCRQVVLKNVRNLFTLSLYSTQHNRLYSTALEYSQGILKCNRSIFHMIVNVFQIILAAFQCAVA